VTSAVGSFLTLVKRLFSAYLNVRYRVCLAEIGGFKVSAISRHSAIKKIQASMTGAIQHAEM
jgi:hypothetical protein